MDGSCRLREEGGPRVNRQTLTFKGQTVGKQLKERSEKTGREWAKDVTSQ